VKQGVPWGLLLSIGLLTFAALLLSGGELAAVAAPVLLVLLLYTEWRAPLRVCAVGLMFLSLIADAPQDNPMGGLWKSPLYTLGALLCNNWSKTFTISALPFSGMDLLCAFLLVRVGLRRIAGHPPGGSAKVASALWSAMAVFIAAIFVLGAFGVGSGGRFGAAYWQVRQLLCIPVFAYLLSEALEGERDYRVLAPVVLAAALIKTAVGMYFYFAIARPQGLDVPCITSHADTLLYCLSLTLVFLQWLEKPDWPNLRRCLWFMPVVMLALFLNNRRIAYVGLAGVLLTIWMLTPSGPAKRALARVGLLAAPLFAAYFLLGWGSQAAFFKPVAAIRTMVVSDKYAHGAEESTRARDIENYNLSQTLRQHPFGTGLGRAYEEVVRGPDISQSFTLYRYIPHNSVLWMMSIAGPVGFFLLWLLFAVGIYLAARSYRRATSAVERMAALSAVCAQLLFLIQAFGDMGTQSWSTAWLMAAALAVSGKLAVSTGAWPETALFRFQMEPAWKS
jgi:hypothetical protein